MEIKENSTMTVTDNEGKEHLMQILFTYENEERQTKYVFFYEAGNEDADVMVMIYNDDGELIEIEDENEYAEVEEVFEAYQEDPKIQEIK